MKYYKVLNENTIECLLCRHHCHIKEGKTGICGVNKNEGNKLKNLVYNHPAALNIDPVEKKPLYHFLPGSKILSIGTVGCNFKCPFCQNWQISQTNIIDTSIGEVTPYDMMNLVAKYKCDGVAYTYNEPSIFYPYAKDIGELVALKGAKNIFVTNGYESIEEIEDMDWLDAANIDLKSFNKEYYKKELKGNLDYILDTIQRMYEKGIWIEITTLLIEGVNNSEEEINQMAEFIASVSKNIPWHLSAFHPDYKMKDVEYTKIQTLQKAYKIGKKHGLNYVYLGNVDVADITYCPECGYDIIVRHRYEVVKNEITKNGTCPKCNTPIAGVWNK
jgi:pyruvate formate lyase activating enzyme